MVAKSNNKSKSKSVQPKPQPVPQPVWDSMRFNDPDDPSNQLTEIEIGSNPELTGAINRALDLIRTANSIMDKAKQETEPLKDEAMELLAPIHLAYNVRGVSGDFGSLSFYQGKNTRLDKKVLQRELILAGVKQEVVLAAMTKATKTTLNDKMTIQLKPPGSNKPDYGD